MDGSERTIRLGLIGVGVVGTGILKLLRDNRTTIAERLGAPLEVRIIAAREPTKERDSVVPRDILTGDASAVVDDPEVDVVVEVMGGVEEAGTLLRRALESGKHVVTANKALLAEEGDALLELAEARNLDLYFEAAVAGGIPIIRVLREALASDRIVALRGIVNGTSNYVLTRMEQDGLGFAEALAEAQAAGYAEADPTLDVGGGDAAHKLAILATLAYGARVHPRQIHVEGIDGVSRTDMEFARRFGFAVKPIAVARPTAEGLDLRVHPALVPIGGVLASISGALNAVYVEGAMVGPCLLSGPGAGAAPTAMSVVSDIVDVGRNLLAATHARVPSRAFRGESLRDAPIRPPERNRGRFYLRFTARDEAGVLGRLAGVLGGFDVSIEQMAQEGRAPEGGAVSVVMLTHEALEGDVRAALAEVDRLAFSAAPARFLRIEDDR
ncbi:MAG: homoserine dehydrogenase [Myxococcota bacterium]